MYNLKCKYMKKNQEPDLVLQIWQKKTWMMMRLVGLICLWCLLGVPKVGYAQARLVSLEVTSAAAIISSLDNSLG